VDSLSDLQCFSENWNLGSTACSAWGFFTSLVAGASDTRGEGAGRFMPQISVGGPIGTYERADAKLLLYIEWETRYDAQIQTPFEVLELSFSPKQGLLNLYVTLLASPP